MSDHYDILRDTQYGIHSTNLADVGTGCSEFPNNSDAISRQAAIDALVSMTIYTKEELKEYREESAYKDCWTNGIYDAVEKIEQLPPIQPEPQYKTNYGFMWLCPKCGLPIHSDYTRCVRCGHNREKGV